jgi:hypothetical protein
MASGPIHFNDLNKNRSLFTHWLSGGFSIFQLLNFRKWKLNCAAVLAR